MENIVQVIANNKKLQKLVSNTWRPRYLFHNLTYKALADDESIKVLKNLYENRPVLVVGNGPSLNNTPLDDFSSVPAIGMNKINLIFDRVNWRPDYIFVTNKLVTIQNRIFFESTDIDVFISWKDRHHIEDDDSIQFYLQRPTRRFQENFAKGVGAAGTVTYACLQFAYYLGADPVILFGVDHDFEYDGDPSEIQEAKGDDVNHFDPNYFSDGDKWGLPNLEMSELGYMYSKKAFEADNRRVLDATIGGELDIFPKISLDRVYSILS